MTGESRQKSPLVEMDGVGYSYGKGGFLVSALTLTIGQGQMVALIGPNGTGKSTMLKLLAGILKPAKGTVKLYGQSVGAYEPKKRARLVSYLPQLVDTSIPFRVEELVSMGLYARGAGEVKSDTGEIGSSTGFSPIAAMECVGLLDKRGSYIVHLSGGERRRAFVAMLLVQGAELALLDEPLQNLDIKYQVEIVKILKDVVLTRKLSCIMALHDIGAAFHFDTVCVMHSGGLYAQGAPKDVITKGLIKDVFEVDVDSGWSGANMFV